MHGQISPLHALWSVLVSILLAFPVAARAGNGDCGIPHTSGDKPLTSDCLFILRASVESEDCLACVCDTSGNGSIAASDAQLCLRGAVGQAVEFLCPECTASGGCPATVSWVAESSFGDPCSNNSDCGGAVCDVAGTGRCTASSTIDLGWTGAGHAGDLSSGSTLTVNVDCTATEAPCGECEIQGVDMSSGACRCANDTQKHCDEGFEQDENDCPACEAGAFVGDACATNADCTAGACTRRCSNDLSPCENPGDCTNGATCDDQAECSNGDPCTVESDCVGTCTSSSQCRCFEGPPIPLIAGNVSICVLPRLTADITGTVDVDSGAASITEPLQLLVHLGTDDAAPCPVCGGSCSNDAGQGCVFDSDCESGGTCEHDDVARDGVRQGTCIGGDNDGDACDVEAFNSIFPASSGDQTGGGTSLDCMPLSSTIGTGPAQTLSVTLATDGDTLAQALPCDGDESGLLCACLVCDTNPAVACASNADCAGQAGSCSLSAEITCETNTDCTGVDGGDCLESDRCENAPAVECTNDNDCDVVSVGSCTPAECTSDGDAGFPQPNDCTDGLCSDAGDGTLLCTAGPDDLFCDDVLQGDGTGAIACTDNNDCVANSEGGTCSIAERRRCFDSTIVAEGDADSRHPVLGSAFCLGATPVEQINDAFGLPGPVRLVRQSTLQSFCETAPAQVYKPGTGNCPD
jgi:hypothetical protein